MGGFTKEELDKLNLGKNYKYPDTDLIENRARRIFAIYELEKKSEFLKFMIVLFMISGSIILTLFYLSSRGLKISNLFKSLKTKIHFPKQNISSKTIIMSK